VDGTGTMSQGYLESSNVQVTTEMVNLITCQRAYEVNTKAITASDQMLNDANNLGTLTT
jgi:flagellar basal-body rod protein FlgG